MVALRSLLFVFDIENTKCESRKQIIVSKDINSDQELAELFDILLKPDFLTYTPEKTQTLHRKDFVPPKCGRKF